MLQWILTILIVLAALGWALHKVVKKFSGKAKANKKAADCSDCSSDCSECPLTKELPDLKAHPSQSTRKSRLGSRNS